ncbi:hypothetical protein PR003_g18827 [Phytophthora rubi]|uniref:Uncharacterized protein n=2 Tax=Phytophthora rubi TaxID=129364 RepID=A0A6A4E0V3_9STRA|nr:hypothetical protein PR003_g18827 [Phytophthora rubi]
MQQSVGASFVLRLVLGLAPEKRAVCQTLREIMNLDNTARLVLVPTTKGLKPISGKTNAADWTNVNQHKLKHPRHRGGRRHPCARTLHSGAQLALAPPRRGTRMRSHHAPTPTLRLFS